MTGSITLMPGVTANVTISTDAAGTFTNSTLNGVATTPNIDSPNGSTNSYGGVSDLGILFDPAADTGTSPVKITLTFSEPVYNGSFLISGIDRKASYSGVGDRVDQVTATSDVGTPTMVAVNTTNTLVDVAGNVATAQLVSENPDNDTRGTVRVSIPDGATTVTLVYEDVDTVSSDHIARGIGVFGNLNVTVKDTDQDNAPNVTDIDDDNDGIVNAKEMFCVNEVNPHVDFGENFPSTNMKPIAGDSNKYSAGYVSAPYSWGDFSATFSVLDGPDAGGYLSFREGATSRVDFSKPVHNLDFAVTDLDNQEVVDLRFYDENGSLINLVGHETFVTTARLMSVTAQEGQSARVKDASGTTVGQSNYKNYVRFHVPEGVSYFEAKFVSTAAGTPALEIINACSYYDTDNDGIPNHLDLDSDNDTIPDNVEAQTGAGYVPPTGTDTDDDGLDDAYDTDNGGTAIDPVNTDGTDTVDYLDTDSDNDGIADIIEAGNSALNIGTTGQVDPASVGNNGLSNDPAAESADDYSDVNGALVDNTTDATNNVRNTDALAESDYRDTDSDDDGIPDSIEDPNGNGVVDAGETDPLNTDTDGDGIPDGVEDANQNGIVDSGETDPLNTDTDGDGYSDGDEVAAGTDPLSATSKPINPDIDGDGIPNTTDLDDDNDGILDTVERYCPLPSVANSISGSGVNQDKLYLFNWDSTDFSDGIHVGDTQTFNLSDGTTIIAEVTAASSNAATIKPSNQSAGRSFGELYDTAGSYETFYGTTKFQKVSFTISFSATKNGTFYPLDLFVSDGEATKGGAESIDFQTNGENWFQYETIGDSGTWTGAGTQSITVIDSLTGNSIFVSKNTSEITININQGNGLEGVVLGTVLVCDKDNDSIPNYLDLDSDNDGISDLVEAGHDAFILDTNNDGKIDDITDNPNGGAGDADSDGLSDAAEAIYGADTGAIAVDTDGDGLVDILDLDSDNDGIPDAVEAQPTTGYVTNDGDVSDNVDDNGIPSYGLVIPNVDADDTADTTPDYLDTDSDGDGIDDTTESGLTLSGTITNGIDDVTNTTYADPDGDISDPINNLANTDSDPSDADYRSLDNVLPTTDDLTSTAIPSSAGATDIVDPTGADADGTVDAYIVNTLPTGGTLLLADGTAVTAGQELTVAEANGLKFDPDGTTNVDATFTLSAKDNEGGIDATPATITIPLSNTLPITNDLTSTAIPSNAGATDIADPTGADTDGTVAAYIVDTLPTGGTLLLADGTAVTAGQELTVAQANGLKFDPDGTTNGNVTFTLSAKDNDGGIDATPATITIPLTNTVPTTDDLTSTAIPSNADATDIVDPTGNDTDGTVDAYIINTLPTGGTLYLADGTTAVTAGQELTVAQANGLKFDPDGTTNADATFTLSAKDNDGGVDVTPATITIPLTNTVPTTDDLTSTAMPSNADATDIVDPTGADADGSVVAYIVNTLPTGGTLYLADGTTAVTAGQELTVAQANGLKFDPDGTTNADATFTLSAKDNDGGVDATPATITIPLSNTVPTTDDLTSTAMPSSAGATDIVDPTGADADGSIVAYIVDTLPTGGTLYLADGTTAVTAGQELTVAQANGLKFDPDKTTDGDITFTLSAKDNDGGVDETPATITIPVALDTDGDGIPDVTDLDDDNDGILDTVEAATATNGGDTDGDGIPDTLPKSPDRKS